MKNPKFIIIGTVFIVTGLLLAVYFLAQKDLLSFFDKKENISKANLEQQINEEGAVSVMVLPKNITMVSPWEFEISLDTHSVELNQDLKQVSILSDDKGNEYNPIRWVGPDSGGHHLEGVLIFQAINPLPSYIELTIENIGGVSKRLFKWDIK